VAAADYGLLVQRVGEPKPWRERLLIHWNIVVAAVRARSYEGRVANARRTYGSAAASDGTIGGTGVPVSQPVKALRPGPLQLIAKPQVQSELAGRAKSVVEVQRTVGLPASSLSWNLSTAFGLVYERPLI